MKDNTNATPIFCAVTVMVLATLPAMAATTIRVPVDQPTIQTAIDPAANGDTVLVAADIYKENVDFKGKAITVQSVDGANTTTIDPVTVCRVHPTNIRMG